MEDEGSAMADQALIQQSLPDDVIVHHIFIKLPVKSLIRFKLVSKQWYFTLSSPQFALTYTQSSPLIHPSSPIQFLLLKNGSNFYLYSHDNDDEFVKGGISTENCKNFMKLGFDYDEELLSLIGSYNGLVCLGSKSGSFFILWNPIIGEFRKYSDPEFVGDLSAPFRVLWGFGYVSSVDDYKVIRITKLGATHEIRVHVFSLKSKKWTLIADQLHKDIFSVRAMRDDWSEGYSNWIFDSHTQGVLVNETLYWITSEINSFGLKIVSFDLVSEEFHNHMNLDDITITSLNLFLFKMGGCLSRYTCDIESPVVEIKMFKCLGISLVETICLKREAVKDSYNCRDIVGFTRTGKIFILLGAAIPASLASLRLVDPITNSVKYIQLSTFDRRWDSRIAGYVPSLTLPYTTD